MEKSRQTETVIDITKELEEAAAVRPAKIPEAVYQTNPIYKKLLNFASSGLKDKFSFKDLFR